MSKDLKADEIQLEQRHPGVAAEAIDAKFDHVPESGLAQLTHWQAFRKFWKVRA